jgi:thymidylate synthase (FAD)
MRIVSASFSIEDQIDGIGICKKIEKAARTCYKSEGTITGDSYIPFLKNLLEVRHHDSVIEHEKVTVRVICDRGVTHEIVRHRIASYSQESTRYNNYTKDKFGNELTIIDPCFWSDRNIQDHKDFELYALWLEFMSIAENYYFKMIANGAKPQEARSVLPNSLKTEIVMTFNMREWRWFFKLRTAEAAHPQMREIAIAILDEFKRRIPILFDDIVVTERARKLF